MSGPARRERPHTPASNPATRLANRVRSTGVAASARNTQTPRVAWDAPIIPATAPRLTSLAGYTTLAGNTPDVRHAPVGSPPQSTRSPQLLRTPITVRARTRLARGAAWRPSLTGAETGAAQKLAERRELVRGPANAALEELLMVGRDRGGEDNGQRAVGTEARTAVQAFQALKAAYLSNQDFLDISLLQDVIPQEVANPRSPTNSLVRLSNLITFLDMVLTAAPDESGAVSRSAVAKLRTAGEALLRHVNPPESPIDDQTIKLIVDLKCQTYLLASSLSRTPVDPAPYFSQTLRQLLPTSRANALTERGAAARFSSLQSSAMEQIIKTGGDWAALKTKWTCEGLARKTRDWVEHCVLQSGLGLGAEASDYAASPGASTGLYEVEAATGDNLESTGSEHEKGNAGNALGQDDKGADDTADDAGEASGTFESAPSGDPQLATLDDTKSVKEDYVGQRENDTQSGESVPLGVKKSSQGAVTPQSMSSSDPTLSDSDDTVARDLLDSLLPIASRTQASIALRQQALRRNGTASGSSLLWQSQQETLHNNPLLERMHENGMILTEELIVVQDMPVGADSPSDRAADLLDLFDETLPTAEETASVEDDSQHEDCELERPLPKANVPVQQAQPGSLRFDGSNRLTREPAHTLLLPRLLERQADAERISFDDSQSQNAGTPLPSATPKDSARAHKGAHSAEGSELSSEDFAASSSERSTPMAGPSTTANKIAGAALYLEPESYGGGEGGVEDEYEGSLDLTKGAENQPEPDDGDDQFSGFDDNDDEGALPPPRQVANDSNPRENAVQAMEGAKSKERERPQPRPQSITARLDAWKALQQPHRTSTTGNNDVSGNRELRPREARKRARASSFSSEEALERSISSTDSDDSSAIPVPPRRKGRAGSARSPAGDKAGRSRQKTWTTNPISVRAPSPPVALGAAGNRYFQGRNQPGLRVPWSTAEIDLLQELLRQLGCNWRRMIELHGPNGSRSRTFSNRTNVSLKDKAVNLALSYVRRGLPTPAYLRNVTIPKTKMPKTPLERLPANETDEESESE